MRRFAARTIFKGSALALGAIAVLCACSSGEAPAAAGGAGGGAGAAAAAARKPHPAASLVSPDMVSAAASAGSLPAPVQVKFELKSRPGAGQPLDIDLVIVPSTGSVDQVSGQVEAGEGLELAAGGQIPPMDRPPQGIPIVHSIKVLPTREGIFTLNAVLKLDSAGQSSSQTFSIPVIVGGGLPEPQKPAAAAGAKRAPGSP
jgi:hypothetical protein